MKMPSHDALNAVSLFLACYAAYAICSLRRPKNNCYQAYFNYVLDYPAQTICKFLECKSLDLLLSFFIFQKNLKYDII